MTNNEKENKLRYPITSKAEIVNRSNLNFKPKQTNAMRQVKLRQKKNQIC